MEGIKSTEKSRSNLNVTKITCVIGDKKSNDGDKETPLNFKNTLTIERSGDVRPETALMATPSPASPALNPIVLTRPETVLVDGLKSQLKQIQL